MSTDTQQVTETTEMVNEAAETAAAGAETVAEVLTEAIETAIAPGDPITTEEPTAEEVLKPSENKTYVITLDHELRDLLDMIYEGEQECRQRERVVENLKEQLKYAKEQFDEAALELRSLIRQSHEKRTGSKNDENRPLLNPPGVGNTEPTEPTEPTTDWRALSTEILLDPPIEGFGAKKRQALLDALPTIGDFHELQCRVGKDAATLRELLPKGIGEQAADALEERLITAIRVHRITDDPEPASESASESLPVAEAVADSPIDESEPESWFQTRAVELYELAKGDFSAFNQLIEKLDEKGARAIGDGAYAYGEDVQVEDCPFKAESDQAEGWLQGWIGCYAIDPGQAEGTEKQEPQEEPQTEPISATKLTQQMLDDL